MYCDPGPGNTSNRRNLQSLEIAADRRCATTSGKPVLEDVRESDLHPVKTNYYRCWATIACEQEQFHLLDTGAGEPASGVDSDDARQSSSLFFQFVSPQPRDPQPYGEWPWKRVMNGILDHETWH